MQLCLYLVGGGISVGNTQRHFLNLGQLEDFFQRQIKTRLYTSKIMYGKAPALCILQDMRKVDGVYLVICCFILVKGDLVNAGIFCTKNVKRTKKNFITGEGGKLYLGQSIYGHGWLKKIKIKILKHAKELNMSE